MNWLLKNWYGLVSWVFLAFAVVELYSNGSTTTFYGDLVICFVTQCAQAVLDEVRKGPDA
jgi:hypothetical protein